MPPQTETQTLPLTLARDVGEVAAALDLARRELARASAECVALRRRNEHLERELVRLVAEGSAHEEARLRAAQAQKIEAIGELTGGIAHVSITC